MKIKGATFESFPKDEVLRLQDAYIYLMALPILLYDFTTLHIQLREKSGVVVL